MQSTSTPRSAHPTDSASDPAHAAHDSPRAGLGSAGGAGPGQAVDSRRGVLGRIAGACYRHRRLTLLGWVAAVAVLITLWMRFGAASNDTYGTSNAGQQLIDQHFAHQSGDTLTLAIRSTAPVDTPAVRDRVTAILTPLTQAPHVTSVSSPYTTPGQISADSRIAFATIQFDSPATKWPSGEVTRLMGQARAASGHGITFSLAGSAVDTAETPAGGPSEGYGLAAAAVVLLIGFGSLLAMGLPILTAMFGIGAGLSAIALLGHLVPAPSFSPIIASMIGLGVGIDYALFIVTRYRESLRDGATPEAAVVSALSTAGRAVLFAGTTVIIGMLGLFVLRQPLLNGVAVAAASTVAMTMIASITLLPALLGFTGARLAKPSRLHLPRRLSSSRRNRPERPLAERWAVAIQRRPLAAAVASTVAILALAAPALGMHINMPDESTQARSTMGYAGYRTLADGFGPGFNAPFVIVAKLPTSTASTRHLAAAVGATPGVARVTPVTESRDGAAAMMIAYPTTGQQDVATNALVNRLHDSVLPAATEGTGIHAYLGGPNAGNVAFANLVNQRLLWLIAVVVALSVLLLTVVFRSVVVALKAAVMNLLSITAAYGVLVAVVQWGWFGHLFGFPTTMPVATWVPMFLFVILFGLSMDYEVFLLSRIREHYDRTGDNAAAITHGLSSTARVISAAAAIMITVFLSVVLGADVSVKQIGLGLAAAIFIDATVVRLVLVPAVMELLGKANWWLPRPLAALFPSTPRPPGEDEPPAEVDPALSATIG